ncbi:MAG: NUDIX hydrolase [Candidatus Saccharibacteria bacterium]|nr:NUDIX hydrolase [Candidatus Saccharibacteria bacterium]
MTRPVESSITCEEYPVSQLSDVVQDEFASREYRPTAIVTCVRAGGNLPGVQVAVVIPNHGTKWGLPQGGIETTDVNVSATARRELKEEIGLGSYDIMYARPTGSAIRVTKPATEQVRDGYVRGGLYFPVAAIATTDAQTRPLDGIWSAGWLSLPCFAEDVVEQHMAQPTSRTTRTITTLHSTLPLISEVLLERNPPLFAQQDIELATQVLKPAVSV